MNMDLHQAKVQQRWCYADDDLPPEMHSLDLEALAHDIQLAPDVLNGPPGKAADNLLDRFEQSKAVQDGGGSIEPADEEAADESTTALTLPAREGTPQMEITGERP
jgi:type IV secretion system protein VirD4